MCIISSLKFLRGQLNVVDSFPQLTAMYQSLVSLTVLSKSDIYIAPKSQKRIRTQLVVGWSPQLFVLLCIASYECRWTWMKHN